MFRPLEVDAFLGPEAVDHVFGHLLLRPLGFLGREPEEVIASGHPLRLDFARLGGRVFPEERIERLQGRGAVVVTGKFCGKSAFVACHGRRVPQAGTLNAAQRTLQVHLLRHLVLRGVVDVGGAHRALHVLPYVERACGGKAAPPVYQFVVVGCGVPDFPVDLRHEIVHPAVVDPKEHVGIKVIVVLQPLCLRAGQVCAFFDVMINAEGRHAEFHPRLHGVDAVAEHLDKSIDIVAPPIVDVGNAVAMRGVGLGIGNGEPRHGVGVEVVVDVQPVHVVAAHDVGGDGTDILAVLRHAGVEENEVVVFEEAFRVLHVGVRRRQLRSALRLGTERVDPRVQLHAALMAFVHHPRQRVPIGRGALSLPPREVAAPRFVGRLVKGVGLAAHLEHHGVHPALLQRVQLIGEIALHGVARKALELAVDKLYPRAPELTLRLRGGLCNGGAE